MLPEPAALLDTCRPVRLILARVGDKWSVLVVETLGQILSPTIAGAIYDATGSYDWALVMFIGTFAAAFVLFALASRIPYPNIEPKIEQITEGQAIAAPALRSRRAHQGRPHRSSVPWRGARAKSNTKGAMWSKRIRPSGCSANTSPVKGCQLRAW